MSNSLPTVQVLSADIPDGYKVINESDLTDEDVLFDADAEKARRKPAKASDKEPKEPAEPSTKVAEKTTEAAK